VTLMAEAVTQRIQPFKELTLTCNLVTVQNVIVLAQRENIIMLQFVAHQLIRCVDDTLSDTTRVRHISLIGMVALPHEFVRVCKIPVTLHERCVQLVVQVILRVLHVLSFAILTDTRADAYITQYNACLTRNA